MTRWYASLPALDSRLASSRRRLALVGDLVGSDDERMNQQGTQLRVQQVAVVDQTVFAPFRAPWMHCRPKVFPGAALSEDRSSDWSRPSS